MHKKIMIAAATAALAFSTLPALATPEMTSDQRTMGPFGCGRLYVQGFTTGTSYIWVDAAGTFRDKHVWRPESVYAVGDHSGYITSYASQYITQWGKSGCSQL